MGTASVTHQVAIQSVAARVYRPAGLKPEAEKQVAAIMKSKGPKIRPICAFFME